MTTVIFNVDPEDLSGYAWRVMDLNGVDLTDPDQRDRVESDLVKVYRHVVALTGIDNLDTRIAFDADSEAFIAVDPDMQGSSVPPANADDVVFNAWWHVHDREVERVAEAVGLALERLLNDPAYTGPDSI